MPETPDNTCPDCDGTGFYSLDNPSDITLCDHPVPADVLERIQAHVSAELEHHAFLEELADRLAAYEADEAAPARRPTPYEQIVWQLHPAATLTDAQWALLDGFEFSE